MAELKGYKELNKKLLNVFKPFGVKEVRYNNEFAWWRDTDTITYDIRMETIHDDWFEEFVEERFGYKFENSFMLSMMHELGHFITDSEISDVVSTYCTEDKKRIEKSITFGMAEEEEKAFNWQYFYLPDEFFATAWAVKYAQEHPKRMKKMWRKIEKAFHEFYRINEVTDD